MSQRTTAVGVLSKRFSKRELAVRRACSFSPLARQVEVGTRVHVSLARLVDVHRHRHQEDREGGSVLPVTGGLDGKSPAGHAVEFRKGEGLVQFLPPGDEGIEFLADDFARRIAEHPAEAVVDLDDVPGAVVHDDSHLSQDIDEGKGRGGHVLFVAVMTIGGKIR